MDHPFRDDGAVAREELLSLEQEHRGLAARIEGLRQKLHRDPGARRERAISVGCGAIVAAAGLITIAWCALFLHASWRRPKDEAALVATQRIAAATELLFATSCSSGCPRCPSVDDLIASRVLDRRLKDDPWGRPHRIVCSSDETLWVYSLGRDGVAHTADDIASDMPESNLETLEELAK
jgi:hypothetical protein